MQPPRKIIVPTVHSADEICLKYSNKHQNRITLSFQNWEVFDSSREIQGSSMIADALPKDYLGAALRKHLPNPTAVPPLRDPKS